MVVFWFSVFKIIKFFCKLSSSKLKISVNPQAKYYFEVLWVLADFISRRPRKIGAQNERIAKIAKKKQMTGKDISYKIIGASIEVKAVEAVAPVDFAQLLTYLK
jgi:hypothetical protein